MKKFAIAACGIFIFSLAATACEPAQMQARIRTKTITRFVPVQTELVPMPVAPAPTKKVITTTTVHEEPMCASCGGATMMMGNEVTVVRARRGFPILRRIFRGGSGSGGCG